MEEEKGEMEERKFQETLLNNQWNIIVNSIFEINKL